MFNGVLGNSENTICYWFDWLFGGLDIYFGNSVSRHRITFKGTFFWKSRFSLLSGRSIEFRGKRTPYSDLQGPIAYGPSQSAIWSRLYYVLFRSISKVPKYKQPDTLFLLDSCLRESRLMTGSLSCLLRTVEGSLQIENFTCTLSGTTLRIETWPWN
jgi:hypothetical protein